MPADSESFRKSSAIAYASLAMMKRAHKHEQLAVELEVLDDPRIVRAMKDFNKGELHIRCF